MTSMWDFITVSPTPADAFDAFYTFISAVYDTFFPVKSITIREKEPPFMTPVIKHLLRRRNKLFQQGRTEAASALSERINNLITRRNTLMFEKTKRGSRELWSCVNRLRGENREHTLADSNITASSLNQHYATISTDQDYTPPLCKLTVTDTTKPFFEEYSIFQMLEAIGQTAAGPDEIMWWFLKGAAIGLATPISYLFNQSVGFAYIPPQWKKALLHQCLKLPNPRPSQIFDQYLSHPYCAGYLKSR